MSFFAFFSFRVTAEVKVLLLYENLPFVLIVIPRKFQTDQSALEFLFMF